VDPEKKCDEVKYVIDLLTIEACKVKAINASLLSRKLVDKVREAQRHPQKPGQDSKNKAREVKLYIKRQKKNQKDVATNGGGEDT
jgi:hypothetical protein